MKRFLVLWTSILLALTLNSCFKKDSTVPYPDRGDVRVDTIAMTPTYLYQLYFRLDSAVVVSSNERTISDLGFECRQGGYHIILNTADFMRIADMGVRTFAQAVDTSGAKWKFDKSDGDPDSIATGQWFSIVNGDTVSNGHIWALDMGKDIAGLHLGLRQVIFDSLKHNTYYFRYTTLQGGAITSAVVPKDQSVDYLFYGIRAGGIIEQLEPPKTGYDLLFTQYTTLLFTDLKEAYPYLVTGVLTNQNNVKVAVDTIHPFSSIDLSVARSSIYSTSQDAIGYNWKVYNSKADSYTVRTNLAYIIQDTRGYYYKMRFVSFYSAGRKGYPIIETQKL
ncbi:MAG: HmuY family protein [Bacteroidota bacterium]